MSKIDNNIINNIKTLSLDMISEASSGDVGIALSSPNIFYTLFMNHLKYDINNINWINKDKVVVSNRFLPVMYSTLHMFGFDISMDSLKEFKKMDSKTFSYANNITSGIDAGSIYNGDVISSSSGIALGQRYLEGLVKKEIPKCNLIDFHTYCICTYDDIMSGVSYESLSFVSKECLNKLVLIVVLDEIGRDSSTKETYTEDLLDRFMALDFNVIDIKNNLGDIDDAIDETKKCKKPSVILVKSIYGIGSSRENSNKNFNMPLSEEELNEIKNNYKIDGSFNVRNEYYNYIKDNINKRMNKTITKWNELKNETVSNKDIKKIIDFLEAKEISINFNADNIKINDNYEEELLIGNSKIFNILASKSPFILSLSDDNFIYTKTNITSSDIMKKDNPTGRNIMFGKRTLAMGGIGNGLATLGFKVFISTPLINSNILTPFIKYSTIFNLPVNYIFTQDNFLNPYENNTISCINEINSLRTIPTLINFRPSDIEEIIGVYNILANYKKACTIIIGSKKVKKLLGTNYKYVLGGAYRVRKERDIPNGVIISTGEEVELALYLSEELMDYGIDLRVITMPSQELFDMQNDKYKNILIPKELKTFVIEFSNDSSWYKYATNKEYILGINNYSASGTKEELLSYHNLDKDYLKAKIIELMKK